MIDESYVVADLRRTRNMRLAFKSGFYSGGIKAGLMTVSGGRLFGGRIAVEEDAAEPRETAPAEPFVPDNTADLQQGRRGVQVGQRDPGHHPGPSPGRPGRHRARWRTSIHMSAPPASMSGLGDELRINAPNCVDCKATDVVGPRWTPREGGSGPKYRTM